MSRRRSDVYRRPLDIGGLQPLALQSFIVRQYGYPLIDKDRLTVAGMLRDAGYYTAAVGKWHLGQGWNVVVAEEFLPAGDHFNNREYPGNPPITEKTRALRREAFSKPTTGGPTTRGFDYYFGVDVPNRPPYCYIENDRTVGAPSEYLPPRFLGNHQASTPGPAMPYRHFQQLLPKWAQKGEEVMDTAVAEEKPFFLYMPLTSPHTPLSPNAKWVGASELNRPYADLVMETDAVFGRVLDALESRGLRDNTLVIFTSGNGFAKYVGAPPPGGTGPLPQRGLSRLQKRRLGRRPPDSLYRKPPRHHAPRNHLRRAGVPERPHGHLRRPRRSRRPRGARDRRRVRNMIQVLEDMIGRGRSTPGPDQSNDAEIDIWKLETMPSVDPRLLDDY